MMSNSNCFGNIRHGIIRYIHPETLYPETNPKTEGTMSISKIRSGVLFLLLVSVCFFAGQIFNG
jgi:hypothetical protein